MGAAARHLWVGGEGGCQGEGQCLNWGLERWGLVFRAVDTPCEGGEGQFLGFRGGAEVGGGGGKQASLGIKV